MTFSIVLAAVVSLAGEWTLDGRLERGQKVRCPCAVPGDVQSALLNAGKMVDPHKGQNELKTQWVGRREWTLSRTFTVPEDLLAKREIVLRLEDVDTFATVSVNGRFVGRTDNRFRRYEFDVKPFLKPGTNTVSGLFASAERIGDDLANADDGSLDFHMGNSFWAKNMPRIRKPACHAGWDWGLAQMVVGFCGTVELVATDGPRLEYVYTDQTFNDDLSHCTLTATAEYSDGSKESNTFEIDNPPLWWPNGYGPQSFYTFDFAGATRRVGLRKLEVLNERTVSAEGKDELSLVFRVNNRRIFAKGANWIPCDAFENRQTPARYRDLLESARDANMNMIRLWGGGKYEKDCFYNLCDELGLLVWHDMMFACAVYPGDAAFLDNVRRELEHQILRLRDHASIALWCGDNECLPGARKEPYRTFWLARSKMQAACVATCDPRRTYWPSSPCCGPGDFGDAWKEDSKGDMHNWRVWHDDCAFDEYYKYRPRFCSEFGFQSFPSMEVAETFASREDIAAHGPHFEWHQKGGYVGNTRIRKTMARYFAPPKDVASELLLSQFQQGMAIRMAVDAWRSQRPRCMGTLFWQLNDLWPVASWSSIEYGGKWKPLQHMARRFYAPVSLVAGPDGRITAVNDTTADVAEPMRAEYWSFDGRLLKAEPLTTPAKAESATVVGRVTRPNEPCFLALRRGDAVNDWQFGFYRDLPLKESGIRFETNGFTLELTVEKPAFFVWANVRGIRGEFDDNAFTLLPGMRKRITFRPKQDTTEEAFRKALTVCDLKSICN